MAASSDSPASPDLQAVLDRLRLDPKFIEHVAVWERLPARLAREVDFPAILDSALAEMLRGLGIERLYTHQAQAVESALAAQHIVVVTPTASGKTLCYNLPILQSCLRDPRTRALYLFPTKALAQDQAAGLGKLIEMLDKPVGVHIYDGDTPTHQRQNIRKQTGVILSNPDMLHRGILPYHTRWAPFFENLRYVVIDELHTYRGIFGSHMANVMRRLRRICQFYGSSPIFLCASATIANPVELAEKLIESPVTLIDDNGAPQGAKHFLIYNPPFIEKAGVRRSFTLESRRIAGTFLAESIQTILFARTRLATELLLGYVRDEMAELGRDPSAIRGYRGGYLPHERRAIEHGLRSGDVRGVVATNALELGIDIGQLDVVIMAGYPGTLASTWQQAGRAGRRVGTSVAILVASSAPLDQYIALHPRYLFERSVENARINPDNLVILLNHIRCAVFELPFQPGEAFGTVSAEDVAEMLNFLAEEGSIHQSPAGSRWVAPQAPAEGISLRTGTNDTILIQETVNGVPSVIGEVDRQTAPLMVHVGAIYLHEGRQFVIAVLDWEQGIALAEQTAVDYYTEAGGESTVVVLKEAESDMAGDVVKAQGLVEVTWHATGYRTVKRYTHETLSYAPILLPEQRFETTAYWLYLTPDLVTALAEMGIMLGPNHYGPNWDTQRNAARARDGYRCRRCNAPEKPGMAHHVHHLTPFRHFGYVPGRNTNYLLANQLENLLTLCPACHRAVEAAHQTTTALGGLGYVLRNLATLYLMCEPGDIGIVVEQKSAHTNAPTITLYDNLPAGLGFSDALYRLHDELLRAARDLIRDCPCAEGCPACVGPVTETNDPGNDKAKTLTLRLVEAMIGL